ncbi:MAG: hypothetical protein GC192_19560 [Bacteroidetes bacterium]|nr:hypothetical protein [Bacteroidota bacterium]
MRNFLLLLATASVPFLASAQLNNLLKDPNIAWAATFETEHDFRLSPKSRTTQIQLTKFSLPENGCVKFVTDNWLTYWFLEEMKVGRYNLFSDADLNSPMEQSALMNKITSIDTVITFDPNSYKETMQVIRNDINPDDIAGFRTQQIIFFDKKSGSYGTQLLALAPLVSKTDATGKVIGKNELAWIPMNAAASADLTTKSPDVIWSALMIDKANSLTISKLKTVKNELKKSFGEQLFFETASMKHPVESSGGYGCGEMLTKAEVENMTMQIDTVITFDPETYKETVQIVKNTYNPSELKEVIMAQEWYYDNKQKILANRLKALAPYVEITDTNQNLLYKRVQFYLHF